jgi:hypothetical protein
VKSRLLQTLSSSSREKRLFAHALNGPLLLAERTAVVLLYPQRHTAVVERVVAFAPHHHTVLLAFRLAPQASVCRKERKCEVRAPAMEHFHIKYYVHKTAVAFTPLPSNTDSETRSAALSIGVTLRGGRVGTGQMPPPPNILLHKNNFFGGGGGLLYWRWANKKIGVRVGGKGCM